MKLYNIKEIEDDIFRFEGIKVLISRYSDVEFRSSRLYSEIYKTPMDDDKTIDDLKNRVNSFLMNDFKTILPDIDIEPNPSDVVTVYITNTEPLQTQANVC